MQKLNVDFSRHAMGRKCIARFVKHWINSTKQKKSILNICQKTIAIIFQQNEKNKKFWPLENIGMAIGPGPLNITFGSDMPIRLFHPMNGPNLLLY